MADISHGWLLAGQMLTALISAVVASSGFWMYYTRKIDTKDARDKLLMGLAHDRIVNLGMQYLERGCVTQDEYENLLEFLYKPYLSMGGNGTVKRIMLEVDKLPIRKSRITLLEEKNND